MKHGALILALALAGGMCVATRAANAADATAAKEAAKAAYDKVIEAYLNSQWAELAEAQKAVMRHSIHLTAKQRADLAYVRKTAAEFRPTWWSMCKSTVPKPIRAKVWGRTVVANYKPSDKPDMSGQVNGMGRMEITVCWNPSLVDSTTPEPGALGAKHKLTTGDLGEVLVWRQLGLTYITSSLPPKTLLNLFNNNKHLYDHLQWFYANVTATYHCSPKARRAAMLHQAATIERPGSGSEAYLRSCRAIASLFTALVLTDPSKWPSVNLPSSTPDSEIEEKTSTYLYSNVEPTWTLDEDKAFREALGAFFRTNGERALKGKGSLLLPNRTGMMLMEPDDRKLQARRDAWVKKRLEAAS